MHTQLRLDLSINPPKDVRDRMCAEYLRRKARKHAHIVREHDRFLRSAAKKHGQVEVQW